MLKRQHTDDNSLLKWIQLPGICHAQEDHKQQNFGKRSWCFQNFWFPICGKTKIMNAAETNILGMLHSQAILARSKESFVDRSRTQGPSTAIKAGIHCLLIGMQPPAEWGRGRICCGVDYGLDWCAVGWGICIGLVTEWKAWKKYRFLPIFTDKFTQIFTQ